MAKARKAYARYFIVHGLQTMWRGNAAQPGALFREFVITSNEFCSTVGTFQVYGLEGASGGIKDGRFGASDDEPKVLLDEDFDGLDAAAKRFQDLVAEAEKLGFQRITMMDILEFEDKLRRSSGAA